MKLRHNNLATELAAMSMKDLLGYKAMFARYFGVYSPEYRTLSAELKKRRAIKPKLSQVIDSIRLKIRYMSDEVKRLDGLRFDVKSKLYHPQTLEEFIPSSVYDPDDILTGKLAYRVAVQRIAELEQTISYLEQHIHSLQTACHINSITLDIMDVYDIGADDYSKNLKKRLIKLKRRSIPGTAKHMPMHRHKYIPQPIGGPKPGDYLTCKRNKNFRAGSYKIIAGGGGYNRYYCRKLLESLQPEDGHVLFVTGYIHGYGHYIISVPQEQCFEKALGYIFTRRAGYAGYYEVIRSTYQFPFIQP